MSQYTVAQIDAQTKVFQDAYKRGEITSGQYNQALRVQAQNRAEALKREQQTQQPQNLTPSNSFWTSTKTSSLPSGGAMLTPSQPGAVISDAKIETQPFVGPPAPGKTYADYTATEVITYKETIQPTQVNALENAKAAENLREDIMLRSSTRGGTSTPGLNIQPVLNTLSPEEKQQFQVWKSEKVTKSMTSLGTFLGAGIAAPIIGPTATLGAAGAGLGISQGFKTAEVALTGGDIKTSLLTPQEALEAAETGIIFSGVSKGVMTGIKAFAPLTVSQTVAGQGAKSVLARASVNAGIGAAGGFVLSGGKLEEAGKGAVFGGLLSVGGEALGGLAARVNAKYDVAPKIFGTKAQELISVSEIEKQVVKGNKIDVTRLTTYQTRNVRLSYKEAKLYNDLGRYSSKPRILLAGTEKVVRTGGGEFETFMRATEANRSANPILEAGKGKVYRMGEARLGDVSRMVETPTRNVLGVVKTKVEVGFKGKSRTPAIKATKTIKASQNIIVPKKQLVVRDFTGIQLKAKVDPQIYAKYGKNLPIENADAIYKSLGGSSKPFIQGVDVAKDLTGSMKPLRGSKGSTEIGTNIEKQFKLSQAKVKQGISVTDYKQMTKTSGKMKAGTNEFFKSQSKPKQSKTVLIRPQDAQEIVLPKPIIKMGGAKTRISGANAYTSIPRSRQTQAYDEETVSLSYPKTELRTPVSFAPSLVNSQINNRAGFDNKSFQNDIRLPREIIRETPITGPIQPTIQKPIQNPIITPREQTITNIMPMPSFPNSGRAKPFFPSFPLGGGGGGFGGRSGFSGKMFKQNNPIKTPKSMLKDFGNFGAKGNGLFKPTRQVKGKRRKR